MYYFYSDNKTIEKGLYNTLLLLIIMPKMQIEVPVKLDEKLKIYSIKNKFVDKRDAVLFLLEKSLGGLKWL